ncbi:MAG TPA: hypothetical protein VGD67_13790 [Pseudonocardiaceae bacterium]
MAQKPLVIRMRVTGARETLRAFRDLPKDASKSLRERSQELAEVLAIRVRAAGTAEGRQAAKVARTVRAARDRVPVITARHPLVYATEFGMNRRSGWYAAGRYRDSAARQFKPHRGRAGYWIFPTVDSNGAEIGAAWRRVADDVARQFGGRG